MAGSKTPWSGDQATLLRGYKRALHAIDRELHDQEDVDDDTSGTTVIATLFEGTTIHVANIGDSRAVLIRRRGAELVARPLSQDQTPWRKDERDRIRECGGLILTDDMKRCANEPNEISYPTRRSLSLALILTQEEGDV